MEAANSLPEPTLDQPGPVAVRTVTVAGEATPEEAREMGVAAAIAGKSRATWAIDVLVREARRAIDEHAAARLAEDDGA